jgi:predicted secreted hydrolase
MEKISWLNYSRDRLAKIENYPVKFWQLLAWVYFMLIGRNLLECLTDNGGKIFDFYVTFAGYPVYYWLNFLAITLVIYFFCRTEIYLIFKTIALFSFFVWLAPVADYIFPFYQNQSYGMITSWDLFFKSFYTLGLGELYLQGASFGVKLEFLLVLIGVFIYLLLKKQNILKALVGSFLSYAVIIIVGLTQTFSNVFYVALGLDYPFDLKILALIQAWALAVIASTIYLIHDRGKFILWVKTINWFRGALIMVMMALGLLFYFDQRLDPALFYSDLPLQILKIGAALIAAFLAWQIARLFNDLADYETERAFSGNNLLNCFNRSELINWLIIYILFYLIFTLSVGYEFFTLLSVAVGLSYFYSFGPVRFKRHFVLSSLACSLAYLFVFFAGFAVLFTSADSLDFIPKNIIYLILAMFALAISFKDAKDEKSDKLQGSATLFTVFGRKLALLIVKILILIAALLPAIFLKQWPLAITGLVAYLIIYAVTRGFDEIGEKKLIFLTVVAYLIISVIFVSAVKPVRTFGQIDLEKDSGWHPAASQEIWFLSARLTDQSNKEYFLSQIFSPNNGTYLTLIGLNDGKYYNEFYPNEENFAATKNQFSLRHALPHYIQSDQVVAGDNYGFKLFSFFEQGLLNLDFKNQPLNVMLPSPTGQIRLANQSPVNFYALTDLSVSGKIVYKNEKKFRVKGEAWLEHLWGSPQIDYQRWSIFNIDLKNGQKMNILVFNYGEKNLIYGSWLENGQTRHFNQLEIKPIKLWENPATKNKWFEEFEIVSDQPDFALRLRSFFPKQEVAGQNVWQGLMLVSGEFQGQAVSGWSNYRQVGPIF